MREHNEPEPMVIPATPEHTKHIGLNLRAQDLVELGFQCPELDPAEAVLESWKASYPTCFVGTADGEPVLVFGVAPTTNDEVGTPWLLATERIHSVARCVMQFAHPWVCWMNDVYPFLANVCHEDNTVSLAWLRGCGFSIGTEPFDLNGGRFVSFWRTPQ